VTHPPADAEPARPVPTRHDPDPVLRIRPYLQAATPGSATTPPDAGPAAPTPWFGTVSPTPDRSVDRSSDPTPGLRPFVLTSGRVASADPAISLETQVTARPEGSSSARQPLDQLAPELQSIVALCVEPLSVAEISARLRLHLGVTKILVCDLRAAGYLDVHVNDVEPAHDPDIILRVINGLRALS